MPVPVLFAGRKRRWTPAAIAGLTYFLPSPSTCFTDAGTTPAAVGDLVYRVVSSYGTAATFDQATEANRMTLRQTEGGKYYLEGAAGKYMTTAASYTQAANQPITLAVSGRFATTAATTAAVLAVGNDGVSGAFRSLFRVSGLRQWAGWGADNIYDGVWGSTNRSDLATTAGTNGVAPEWYTGGVANGVTTTTGQYTAYTNAAFSLNCYLAPAVSGNLDYLFFGWGWRLGTAKLTAGEVALLDAYQRGLYA